MVEYSYSKRAILRALSENSRVSVTELSKIAKCSRNTVIKNIKSLESEFQIKYTIDFSKEALGLYQRHFVTVKFDKKPNVEVLEKTFKDDPFVHLVATAEGAYDLLLYAVSDSGKKYMKWETSIAPRLIEYGPVLKPSQLTLVHIGYIPVLDSTLKEINLTRLGLDELDRKILLLLNSNSRLSYNSIARATKSSEDVIRYRFRRILDTGIIEKMTISIEKSPLPYVIAFFVNYKFKPGTEMRARKAREHYMSIDGPMPLVNNFQLLAPLSGSYRVLIVGCFDNEKDANEKALRAHKQFFAGDEPTTTSARITKVLKGSLPIRNIDVRKDYIVINWED